MRALPWLALLFVLGVGRAALDDETGVRPWLHLRGELAEARARIAALRQQTASLRDEAARTGSEPFALERAIREELELVRPGQTLLRLRPEGTQVSGFLDRIPAPGDARTP